MAVNTTHPDYDAAAVEWSRARDVLAGEDAVMSVTGYCRRVGWDLVFMVRFYPDGHFSPEPLGSLVTDELQTVHNN